MGCMVRKPHLSEPRGLRLNQPCLSISPRGRPYSGFEGMLPHILFAYHSDKLTQTTYRLPYWHSLHREMLAAAIPL